MTVSGRLAAVVLLGVAFTSCSNGSGNDGGGSQTRVDAGKRSFASAVNDDTRQWAVIAAPMFITNVTAQLTDGPAIAAYNKTSITSKLCDHLSRFREEARDSDDVSDLETEALEFADQSAVDSAVAGLFSYALAAEPTERDRLLNQLFGGPNYADDPAIHGKGIEFLNQAGLLEPSGKITVPSTEFVKGRDLEGPYERYRNWFTKQPGVVVSAGKLALGIRDALRDCANRS